MPKKKLTAPKDAIKKEEKIFVPDTYIEDIKINEPPYNPFKNGSPEAEWRYLQDIISERLKRYRFKRGVSIRKLSELSGVSTAVISDTENGKNVPRLDILAKLSKAMYVSIFSLLGFSSEEDAINKESLFAPIKYNDLHIAKSLKYNNFTMTETKFVMQLIYMIRESKKDNTSKTFENDWNDIQEAISFYGSKNAK